MRNERNAAAVIACEDMPDRYLVKITKNLSEDRYRLQHESTYVQVEKHAEAMLEFTVVE